MDFEQDVLFGARSVPNTSFPKYAIYQGAVCRVLYYEGDGVFRLLGKYDAQMSVHRDRFAFKKGAR